MGRGDLCLGGLTPRSHRGPSTPLGSPLGPGLEGEGGVPVCRGHLTPSPWERGWIPGQEPLPRAAVSVPRALPVVTLEAGARIVLPVRVCMGVFHCVAPKPFSLLAKPGCGPSSDG